MTQRNQAQRNENQYVLPFEAAQGELLAQVNMLRNVPTELTPVRTDKVVELLERLILLGNDLTERDGLVHVRAQVIALAARIQRRATISDRAIRTWRSWAEQIGVLETDFRSQRLGRREWNVFIINVARIREIVQGARTEQRATRQEPSPRASRLAPNTSGGSAAEAGSGRKWPEVSAAPRPEVSAAPRPEVSAALKNGRDIQPNTTATSERDTRAAAGTQFPADTRPRLAEGEVVRLLVDFGIGLAKASTLVAEARQRGCDTRHLLAIGRWWQRSQRLAPSRWRKPDSVLIVRVENGDPAIPAYKGWIGGPLRPPPKPRRPNKPAGPTLYAERARQQNHYRDETPMTELFQRGQVK